MRMYHTSSKLLQHMFVEESHKIVIESSCRPAFTQIKTQLFNLMPKCTNFIFISGTFNNKMENRIKRHTRIKMSHYYGKDFSRDKYEFNCR